ncbi:hypothetical protein D3C76_1643320 [compost metagenome]
MVDTVAGLHLQAPIASQLVTQRGGFLRVAAPDLDLLDRPHQAQRLQLQACLFATADQGHAAAVLARKPAGGHCAGRGRAHGSEVAVVEEQGIEQAGACR